MDNNFSNNKQINKIRRGKIWVICNIYLYIIGINLVLRVIYKIIFAIIPIEKSVILNIFLTSIEVIATVFTIKWALESIFKKTIILVQEFLKISLLVGIIPVIFDILLSAWLVYINLENFSQVAWYLAPRFLSDFITAFISGMLFGAITYYWFKKLSAKK